MNIIYKLVIQAHSLHESYIVIIQLVIGSLATPVSIAAFATEGQTKVMSLGLRVWYNIIPAKSKVVYFVCQVNLFGESFFASSAAHILPPVSSPSFMVFDLTSRAPLNIKGKPSTLFIWLG